MNPKIIILSVFLLFSLGGNLYFFSQSQTAEAAVEQEVTRLEGDKRISIRVRKDQHEFVKYEMRGFVESIALINKGLIEKDASFMAEAARKSGVGAKGGPPAPEGLGQALPKEFLAMARPTHKHFSEIAEKAKAHFDEMELRKELDGLLNRCVTCHSVYRMDPL